MGRAVHAPQYRFAFVPLQPLQRNLPFCILTLCRGTIKAHIKQQLNRMLSYHIEAVAAFGGGTLVFPELRGRGSLSCSIGVPLPSTGSSSASSSTSLNKSPAPIHNDSVSSHVHAQPALQSTLREYLSSIEVIIILTLGLSCIRQCFIEWRSITRVQ
jgi:hypothetical protein